jgi:hypothetical protein
VISAASPPADVGKEADVGAGAVVGSAALPPADVGTNAEGHTPLCPATPKGESGKEVQAGAAAEV